MWGMQSVCRLSSPCLGIVLVLSFIGYIGAQKNATFGFTSLLDTQTLFRLINRSPCYLGFVNLEKSSTLVFQASENAIVPPGGRIFGNGKQLQCQNSSYCYNFAVNIARCVIEDISNDGLKWKCEAVIGNSNLELHNLSLSCQGYLGNDYCVIKESCVLFYSFVAGSQVNVTITFVLVMLGIAGFVGLLCICVCLQQCNRWSQPSAATTSPSTAVVYTTRSPATMNPIHYPPPYEVLPSNRSSVPGVGSIISQNEHLCSRRTEPVTRSMTELWSMSPGTDDAPPPYSIIVSDQSHVQLDNQY